MILRGEKGGIGIVLYCWIVELSIIELFNY